MSVRADFKGGLISSDFGALLLSNVDSQINLSQNLAASVTDNRHPSYIKHELEKLVRQRIYLLACGYEDCNDSANLIHDPLFKLAIGQESISDDAVLASQPTLSRFENSATTKDVYRMTFVLVDQFIASYHKPPKIMIIDVDHTSDSTHGEQEGACYNHHYHMNCYMPLAIHEGLSGKLITGVLRPGKRPKGMENAAIMKRVLKRIRRAFPETHIILRGDGHFSNPELMTLCQKDENMDFIFGLASNKILAKKGKPLLQEARELHAYRRSLVAKDEPITGSRLFEEFQYAAASWPKEFRVIQKAEVTDLGDNPRFIVTSLNLPSPEVAYSELYCARGNAELYIKELKCDLASDRTSCCRFLANCMRFLFSCAAYQLMHTLRSETLRGTELANAQASTIRSRLFKIAVRVVQCKDRVKLHLPTFCPFKDLLKTMTERLYCIPSFKPP